MGPSKLKDFIKIMIKILNPNQEPSASTNVPNKDFKDMDVLCIFNINLES